MLWDQDLCCYVKEWIWKMLDTWFGNTYRGRVGEEKREIYPVVGCRDPEYYCTCCIVMVYGTLQSAQHLEENAKHRTAASTSSSHNRRSLPIPQNLPQRTVPLSSKSSFKLPNSFIRRSRQRPSGCPHRRISSLSCRETCNQTVGVDFD